MSKRFWNPDSAHKEKYDNECSANIIYVFIIINIEYAEEKLRRIFLVYSLDDILELFVTFTVRMEKEYSNSGMGGKGEFQKDLQFFSVSACSTSEYSEIRN